VHWLKKVVHMPIAERYLLISLGLLTFRPRLVLWLIVVTVAVALMWTQGGRTARVLLRRDPSWAAQRRPHRWGHLDDQLDLGPVGSAVGRFAGRLTTAPVLVGLAGAGLLALAAWPLAAGWTTWALAAAILGTVLAGAGLAAPLHHPLAWQAPALLWAAEAVVVAAAVHHAGGAGGPAAFAFLAAVAYHRYDTVYRLRDLGAPPARWLSALGLGSEGRVLVVVVVAVVAPDALAPVLWSAAAVLALAYLAESARGWTAWSRAQARHPGRVAA
jgi:hypothetical protein